MLYLLCAVLGQNKRVAMAGSSYIQSELVFRSFGYDITYFKSDKFGVTVNSLNEIMPDIILINPNFTNESSTNMPINRRLEIIEWAKKNGAVIIEDDYNGELRYSTHPVPCVQNYGIENTVYLGSFSKVLLPSVRISYMVLPDSLMSRYIKIKSSTNQTASKAEQLALAKYIETGKIDAHLRKARRIYLEKSRIMLENIKKHFGDSVRVLFNETSLHISLFTDRNIDRANADQMLKRSSVGIMPYKTSDNEFRLSFSGIPQEKIADGIELLADIIGKK